MYKNRTKKKQNSKWFAFRDVNLRGIRDYSFII